MPDLYILQKFSIFAWDCYPAMVIIKRTVTADESRETEMNSEPNKYPKLAQ